MNTVLSNARRSICHFSCALIFSATISFATTSSERPAQEPVPSPPPASPQPSPTAPAQPNPTASPNAHAGMSHMMKTWQLTRYKCDSGDFISVNSRGKIAHLRFKDQSYDMKQLEFSPGTKYSAEAVTWTVQGEVGTLEEQSNPDKSVVLAKGCTLESKSTEEGSAAAEPAEKVEPGTLSGTVAYLQRIAIPPSAVAIVTLQDTSLADAAAESVAEEKIPFGTRQVPIPFTLKFDPAKIDPTHVYSVRARIEVGGQMRFTSDKAQPVLTRGSPASGINLILVALPATP